MYTYKRMLPRVIRSDFITFLTKCFATLNPTKTMNMNWHVELFTQALQGLEQGDESRLLINVPPRCLKSITINVAWSAWLLGQRPDYKIISVSYSQALSEKHHLDVRKIMESAWYKQAFPATRICHSKNTQSKFLTTAGGFRLATSVGGTLTGEGGDVIIVDDPINAKQACSKTIRQNVLNWYRNTLMSRLDDHRTGKVVVVMQRLHPDDLAGHLLLSGDYKAIVLQARADAKTEIRVGKRAWQRSKGQLLDEIRLPPGVLQAMEFNLGKSAYAAQYQQRPVSEASSLLRLEWFGQYDELPQFTSVVQSWDCAVKAGISNDFSVCTTWGITDIGQFYLLDVLRDRLPYPELRREVTEQCNLHQPNYILVEDKASGQQLLQERRDLPLVAINPRGDKEQRFLQCLGLLESGKVFLPQAASWRETFLSELIAFPISSHDDQVDSMTQFLLYQSLKQQSLRVAMRRL
jgi:predicted phage terminase large subunit-like protein